LDDVSLNPASCVTGTGTAFNPLTHVTQVVTTLTCPYGPPITTSLSDPMPIGGVQLITSVAPPNTQFYEFSTPASSLNIAFSSPTSAFDGTLSLYDSNHALVNSGIITDGFGELDSTGLFIGSNYILGVDYDVPADPTFRLTFSSAVNAPVSTVPEPV